MELRPTANDELGNSRHKFERHNYIRAMKGYGRHHVLHYTISVAHAHVQHRHHARARARFSCTMHQHQPDRVSHVTYISPPISRVWSASLITSRPRQEMVWGEGDGTHTRTHIQQQERERERCSRRKKTHKQNELTLQFTATLYICVFASASGLCFGYGHKHIKQIVCCGIRFTGH